MKRLIILIFSLCLFASVEGQSIIRANAFASAQVVAVGGDDYGEELCPDPGFDNTAVWWEFDGYSVAGGVCSITHGTENYMLQSTEYAVAGHTYKVEVTISSITEGYVNILFGGTACGMETVANTYVYEIVATNTSALYFGSNTSTTATLTAVSVKEKL